jgi:poly(hydroxyalkanoate) depolymerase family esterase
MKPYEQFVGNLLQAVGASQGKDPAAATEIIQKALRDAGLLQPMAQPAAEAPAQFVDVNEAPAWARGWAKPEQGADAMPDWSARFMPGQSMRGKPGHSRPGHSRPGFKWPGHAKPERSRPADEPGQFLSGSFSADAGTRGYRLYVPAHKAEGAPALVVMLHGCQQNPDDFAAGTRMNALAEASGCLVLYPEQTRSANHSNCWNWFEAPHQQRELGEPSILAGMTREVMREHGVDPAKVYVAGLSAGGAMAAILGATHPELYAAIGVHSGLPVGSAHDLMSALNAMKGARGSKKRQGAALHRTVPAIVFHGDQDATVHPSNGQAIAHQFAPQASLRQVEQRGQGGAGRGYTRTSTLDGADRVVAEHWVVHGAGHAWAGGSTAGSYADPAGPDASAEMLRFFLAQAPGSDASQRAG